MENAELQPLVDQLTRLVSALEPSTPSDVNDLAATARGAAEAFERVVDLQGRIVGVLESHAELLTQHDQELRDLAAVVLALRGRQT